MDILKFVDDSMDDLKVFDGTYLDESKVIPIIKQYELEF